MPVRSYADGSFSLATVAGSTLRVYSGGSWTVSDGGGGSGDEFDHSTDFSEYTTGNVPSDWTLSWESTSSSYSVGDESGATGGKVLETTTSEQIRRAILWDTVGQVSDVEIAARVRPDESSSSACRILARSNDSSDQSGTAYYTELDTTADEVSLSYYDNGSQTTVATAALPFTIASGTYYNKKFRLVGDSLSVKVWQDGNTEPDSWDIDATDATIGSGYVGVHDFDTLITFDTYDVEIDPTVQDTTGSVVTTDSVDNIGTTSADFTGTLQSLEGDSDAAVWFEYRLVGEEPTSETGVETLTATGQFTHTASGLQSDSEYDVWAMVSVGGTTYAGNILTFTTAA